MMANNRYGCNLTKYDLRKIYKDKKITIQKIQSMLAPERPKSYEEQLVLINELRDHFHYYM